MGSMEVLLLRSEKLSDKEVHISTVARPTTFYRTFRKKLPATLSRHLVILVCSINEFSAQNLSSLPTVSAFHIPNFISFSPGYQVVAKNNQTILNS